MASLDLLMVNSEIKNNKMPKAQKIRKRKIVINNIKPLDIKVSYIGELKNKYFLKILLIIQLIDVQV